MNVRAQILGLQRGKLCEGATQEKRREGNEPCVRNLLFHGFALFTFVKIPVFD